MKSMRLKLIICLSLLTLLTGCRALNTPPSVADIQQSFENNHHYLFEVVDYLTTSGYENVYILNLDGTMQADLSRISVPDDIEAQVLGLLKSGACTQICKIGETVSFLCWTGPQDIGCGIVYSADTPYVQFMTQCVPLSIDGWYYYVSDYNTWRNEGGTPAGEG